MSEITPFFLSECQRLLDNHIEVSNVRAVPCRARLLYHAASCRDIPCSCCAVPIYFTVPCRVVPLLSRDVLCRARLINHAMSCRAVDLIVLCRAVPFFCVVSCLFYRIISCRAGPFTVCGAVIFFNHVMPVVVPQPPFKYTRREKERLERDY